MLTKSKIAITILLLSLAAAAQAAPLPDAPKPTVKAAPAKVSTLTKVSIVLAFAGTVADVESTTHALRAGCVEANPVLGANPSRAKLYAITLPVAAGISYLAYRISRHGDRGGWVAPLLVGAIHAAAAGHNISTQCH